MLPDPADGAGLPLGVALGRVDAQHIHAGFHQSGHTVGVVAGVDTGTHHIALIGVQQLVGVLLMRIVVLAEDDILQVACGVHQRQGVDLVVPDDVVAVVQGGILRGGNQLLDGGHEGGNGGVIRGMVDAVVTGCHDAQQLAVGRTVLRDGDGGMAGAGLQLQHIVQGSRGRQVGVGHDVTGLVALDTTHHGGFILNALRAVDEGHTALPCQCNGQLIAGDRLHDGADHGDIHLQRALLLPLAVLDQRGLEADGGGYILCRGIAGNQQVLAKGAGGFFVEISHSQTPFLFACRKRITSISFTFAASKLIVYTLPQSRPEYKPQRQQSLELSACEKQTKWRKVILFLSKSPEKNVSADAKKLV